MGKHNVTGLDIVARQGGSGSLRECLSIDPEHHRLAQGNRTAVHLDDGIVVQQI
jgi:hypothetical protein